MDEHLDQKTNNQLKQLLRDFGLPVSGNKSTLIARLRAKYCSLADEIENGSDDDEQFDEQLEEFMANAHEYCQDGMQNEDAEYDLSDHDLHFLGTLQRNQAQLPSHLYQCPLVEQMTKYIERTFNMKFIRPDASALEQILVDSTPVLNNSRSPKTHQAYMTVGCLFLIYICFFTTSPVDISSALFTWKNCADFLKQYVTMPKRITLRGTAGLALACAVSRSSPGRAGTWRALMPSPPHPPFPSAREAGAPSSVDALLPAPRVRVSYRWAGAGHLQFRPLLYSTLYSTIRAVL